MSVAETDGNIGIVSKPSIPSPLVSVSVSIEPFFESRYQSRYRSRGLCIFCKLWADFLLSKVSVSVSVPVHFPGISINDPLHLVWCRVTEAAAAATLPRCTRAGATPPHCGRSGASSLHLRLMLGKLAPPSPHAGQACSTFASCWASLPHGGASSRHLCLMVARARSTSASC